MLLETTVGVNDPGKSAKKTTNLEKNIIQISKRHRNKEDVKLAYANEVYKIWRVCFLLIETTISRHMVLYNDNNHMPSLRFGGFAEPVRIVLNT